MRPEDAPAEPLPPSLLLSSWLGSSRDNGKGCQAGRAGPLQGGKRILPHRNLSPALLSLLGSPTLGQSKRQRTAEEITLADRWPAPQLEAVGTQMAAGCGGTLSNAASC